MSKTDKHLRKALELRMEERTGHKTKKHFLNDLEAREAEKELKDELRSLRLRDNNQEQGQPLHEEQPPLSGGDKG